MARIEKQPKVILTKEEIETLNKTRKILTDIGICDNDGTIFNTCENTDSEWWWIERFLETLVNISEVK